MITDNMQVIILIDFYSKTYIYRNYEKLNTPYLLNTTDKWREIAENMR